MKNLILPFLFLMVFLTTARTSLPHSDTKDGPVVAAATQAIEQNNINYVLIWVQPIHEKAMKEAFDLTMKVRRLSEDARTLADNYFYETVVRLHRTGEGIAYTGVKPSGTPIDEKILAADKSIAAGNLSPVNSLVPKDKTAELEKRFEKVMSLKAFDVNDVEAGRAYVEAYVQYFHFVEGDAGHSESHAAEGGHWGHIPWILSGIFLFTSVLLGTLYYRSKIQNKEIRTAVSADRT